jgi:predicted CXXCH cytochrome family protein
MKKTLLFAAIMLLVATAAFAGISNTKHNLSGLSGGVTTELCAYCHTPHFANNNMKPLWNRPSPTGYTFTFYGVTVNNTPQATTLGAASGACMSCHDGITSVNALTNVPGSGLGTAGTPMFIGTTPALSTSNATNIGSDLSNDHPVSIGYNTALAGLNGFTTSSGDNIVRVLPTSGLAGANGNAVECVSCHDPHVESPAMFLRKANTGSALCLTCHNK